MKLRILTTLLLILSLTKINAQETVSETCSTLDSNEVVYTLKQDLNCIKCLMQSPLKDSLINQYQYQVKTADTIINSLHFSNNELNNLNTEQGKKITKLRWTVLKVGVISLLSGFLAAIIML